MTMGPGVTAFEVAWARTVGECLAGAADRLRAAGVDSARREARLLLARATGRPADWLLAHPEATVDDIAGFDALVDRRIRHEPLSHIVGRREFWSLSFAVGPAVLDPRPDSETLVAEALARFPDPATPLRVADLGTGSGCLLLSVLSERPRATGIGVDLSPAAARLAAANARQLGLAERAAIVVGDWGTALGGEFDLVLCNPPYIPSHAIAGLAPEVAVHEPALALDGGSDGLDAYRTLASDLCRLVAPAGSVLFEFGPGQEATLPSILAGGSLETVAVRSDLAGRPRCLVACPDKKKLGKGSVTV